MCYRWSLWRRRRWLSDWIRKKCLRVFWSSLVRNAKAAKKSDEMNKESFKDFNSLLYNGVHKSLSVFLVLVECVSLMRDDRIKYFGRILLLQLFFYDGSQESSNRWLDARDRMWYSVLFGCARSGERARSAFANLLLARVAQWRDRAPKMAEAGRPARMGGPRVTSSLSANDRRACKGVSCPPLARGAPCRFCGCRINETRRPACC